MAELKIVFTEDRVPQLEVDTWLAIREGSVDVRAARDLTIVFVVDESGAYLPEEEAKKVVGRLKISQLFEIFGEISKAAQDDAIPPATGG